MKVAFEDNVPENTKLKPILISGSVSTDYSGSIFITLSNDNVIKSLYEIRYNVHFSPFKEALLIDNLLAVGHEEHFYMFDLLANENILILQMSGYFGHLYYDKGNFCVADADGLHCINKNGGIVWRNTELAIDGVIVHHFTDDKILGSGEFDPSGGWVDFSIDRATGIKIL